MDHSGKAARSVWRFQPRQTVKRLPGLFLCRVVDEHTAAGDRDDRNSILVGDIKIVSRRLGAEAIWMGMHHANDTGAPFEAERKALIGAALRPRNE